MTEIKIGQVYESCQPTFMTSSGETHTRIRVIQAFSDPRRVWVATLTDDGREIRRRYLLTSQLHATGKTRDGRPRRTGYRLIQEADHA